MTGAISTISHGGFQSELLAQYVFSSWGTVVATPNPQDHGIDLFCNLVEVVGKRAWAREPYTVQVKSNMDPWVFDGTDSVRWLIDNPLPLFLSVVDKREARLRVYHTCPRFLVWSQGDSPERLTLRPTKDEIGYCTELDGKFDFSLGAPILDVSLSQLLDNALMVKVKAALELWINVENQNLTLQRAGLRRFRMPHEYRPNDCFAGWAEMGNPVPTDNQIKKGIGHLAEALDCLGNQLFNRSDLSGAVKIAVAYRHIVKAFPEFVDPHRFVWALKPLCERLNEDFADTENTELFAGLDRIDHIVNGAMPSTSRAGEHLETGGVES